MKKIQSGVDMEPSSCSLQFIVLEYDMQTSGEKKDDIHLARLFIYLAL